MLNLEKYSGLPISLNDDLILQFQKDLGPVISHRDYSPSRNYFKEPSGGYWRPSLYDMYRNVALPEHREQLRKFGIQDDLTVIPPGRVGSEFVHTVGHFHSAKHGTTVLWLEVYEVNSGETHLILQKAIPPSFDKLTEVIILRAQRGDKYIIPPGYGHVHVNATDDVLVLSNWQPSANQSTYEAYEKHNGPAYYPMVAKKMSPDGKNYKESCDFVPNLTYDLLPKIIYASPRDLPQFNLLSAIPMYFSGMRDLQKLDFLINPENYLEELVPEKLFKLET